MTFINVKDDVWRAAGDGATDDSAKIQGAIDAAAAKGGGVVYLPPGKYLLATKDSNGAILYPKSGVILRGAGNASILTVPDSWDTKNWDVFRTNTPTADFGFEDFAYDGNGNNNVPTGTNYPTQTLLYLLAATRMHCSRVYAHNGSGNRVLSIGNQGSAKTASDISITDCVFETFADTIAGNAIRDHSTIWIRADRAVVSRNILRNPTISVKATAIESQCANSVVSGNVIENYNIGIIVAALFDEVRAHSCCDNVMRNVQSGYRITSEGPESAPTQGPYLDCIIDGGSVEQKKSSSSLVQPDLWAIVDLDWSPTPIESITIRNLDLSNIDSSPSDQQAYGVGLGRAKYVEINNVTFRNTSGRAISRGQGTTNGWNANQLDLVIRDCTFIDCGRTSAGAGYTDYVGLFADNKLKLLEATNLVFRSTSASTQRAFTGTCPVGHLIFKGNEVLNLADGMDWYTAATLDHVDVDHVSASADPEGLVRASIWSRWRARSTGHLYIKKTGAANNNTGWARELFGTAAPTTNTWRVKDLVWNTAPSPGGYLGWICTTAGTPGTWKGFGLIAS